MIILNMHEAKTHLSRYIKELEKGEKILLCRRNKPIAEIIPVEKKPVKERPIGLAKGEFTVPQSFFDELPQNLLKYFSGEEAAGNRS